MTPEIIHMEQRSVVGFRTQTNLINIQSDTQKIAQHFMPRRNEVNSRIGDYVFSIQNYSSDFDPSNPRSPFEKWIGVEVSDPKQIPVDMELFELSANTYAVFQFKGKMSDFPGFRARIFQEWLPNSGYRLTSGPHFEIMGEGYSKDFNNTEESVYIPVVKN